jgi:hypothetical protein
MFVYLIIAIELAILYTVFWYIFVREPKPCKLKPGLWGRYEGLDVEDSLAYQLASADPTLPINGASNRYIALGDSAVSSLQAVKRKNTIAKSTTAPTKPTSYQSKRGPNDVFAQHPRKHGLTRKTRNGWVELDCDHDQHLHGIDEKSAVGRFLNLVSKTLKSLNVKVPY